MRVKREGNALVLLQYFYLVNSPKQDSENPTDPWVALRTTVIEGKAHGKRQNFGDQAQQRPSPLH